MYDEPHHDEDLAAWLELADEAVRRHRQGRVLAVDPALVLRGLPAMWRPATAGAGPADDVVALAGVALARLDAEDPVRGVLLEAAAGCRGSDLPALLRQVRPLLEGRRPTPAPPAVVAPPPDEAPGGPPGRRLAAAGVVAAAMLVALGASAAVTGGRAAPTTDLGAGPVAVADDGAVVRWDPPHLEVDVGQVRYRYRLAGDVEAVAWRDDPRRPTLVVRAGGSRWEVPVPVLDRVSGTAGPR